MLSLDPYLAAIRGRSAERLRKSQGWEGGLAPALMASTRVARSLMTFFATVGLIVSAATTALPQAPSRRARESADVKELRRLEKVWNDAQLAGDDKALDRLWAPDIVITVPNMPLMDKSESLAFVQAGMMKFKIYQTSDLRIRVYRDAAVVTGQLERTRANYQGFEDDWRFTKVYVRRAGRWQVVAWQGSHVGN